MLLFGVCINDIEKAGIDWKKVVNMLQKFDSDLYESFCDDMGETFSERDVEDWFSNYETEGRSGIGAFFHNLIENKEKITLDTSF